MLSNCDIGSPEKMAVAKEALKDLKIKSRRGFRELAAPLHPDHNPNKKSNDQYKEYARVNQIISGLTVGALHGLYDDDFEQHTQHYAEAPVDHCGRTFETAQTESFMAFAKHYKGPMTPLGWMGNQAAPPPSGSPGRTFVKELPGISEPSVGDDLVDVSPNADGPPRSKR